MSRSPFDRPPPDRGPPRPHPRAPTLRRARDAARNAVELVRAGRLGEDYSAPYEIVEAGEHHRVRRYAPAAPGPGRAPVALLVPPLMVTAEIYDVAPDTSAVAALGAAGVRVYVVDFGAPERESGGLERSLDDHVRGVVGAIARVRQLEGRDVHLLGYSQGGMFAYQAAAYVRSEGVASVVTFGSPVDLHKNLAAVRSDLTGALVRAVEPAFRAVTARLESLPGKVTSTGFKLLSTRKELEQRLEFLRLLHDRRALVRREARRRFLAGAGFVAWPGPAFRAFVDQFVVHNRMLTGGFVIDGRLVSLSDIRCPVLAFLGASDELARPATVRAVTEAAPHADVSFVTVPAGHFGLVVGSRANLVTWPTVSEWIFHREGLGPEPEALRARDEAPDDALEPPDFELEVELFFESASRVARSAWRRLGDVLAATNDTADAVRFQEPRLRRLARIEPDTVVSPSAELARRAASAPDATFFLWRGRAFSYADADRRTTAVVRALHAVGVRPGERVGIVMETRPSLLSAVTALVRLGAVAVLAPPHEAETEALDAALGRAGVARVIADPEHAARALRAGREVLVLGGGPHRAVAAGARDLEAIDADGVVLPGSLRLDSAHARDVSMVLLRPDANGSLRAAPVTNHRWALSALGAAAACTLKPGDTVFSAVPLHHPTGILVAVGAAIAGGTRLALGEPPAPSHGLDAESFLAEVRRTGATVVFYAGEMLRPLLEEPVTRADRTLPVRLFAGSGMRADLAARLRERFGIGSMEFYAGTTHRAILADPQGAVPGALGRVLPGSSEVRLVRVDLASGEPRRNAHGRLEQTAHGEPGLLAVRVDGDELAAAGEHARIERGAFTEGDLWLLTADVLARDATFVHTFVDSLGGFVATPGGPVSTRAVEDALYGDRDVQLAAVGADGDTIVASLVTRGSLDPGRLAEALGPLPPHAWPEVVARVDNLPLSEGFRVVKGRLGHLVAGGRERLRRVGRGYERA